MAPRQAFFTHVVTLHTLPVRAAARWRVVKSFVWTNPWYIGFYVSHRYYQYYPQNTFLSQPSRALGHPGVQHVFWNLESSLK